MWVALGALFGVVFGSFLNVVIYRVPEKESLLASSHCASCDMVLKPWMNVPVVSWFFLRGRCYYCNSSISFQYPLIELLTAMGSALTVWYFSGFGVLIVLGMIGFLFSSVALTVIDWRHGILPNVITYPSYLLTLFFVGEDFSRAVLGGVILGGFYLLLILIYPKGMGWGDVKLAPLLGFVTGWFGWGSLVIGGFSAYIFATVYLGFSGKFRKGVKTPFGPWMIAGAWFGVLFGGKVFDWYVSMLG